VPILAAAAVVLLPFVAYPVTPRLLQDDAVVRCFTSLLADAGGGWRDDERGAFLIREGGRFRCQKWPAHFGFHRADWHGRIPDGAVAIVHTHPRALPRPSARDAALAQRLAAPVIVITPQAVTAVLPEEPEMVVLAAAGWQNAHALTVVDNLLRDETRTDPSTHARQAGALPHQRR
jgi:proteasome lid subunit RPN8/RPN11